MELRTHPIIGHVHLKVSDLERAVEFYQNVIGLKVQQRMGSSAAFLSFGEYHHHIGLNVWESKEGKPPAPGSTGLYHFAILYPNRKALANAVAKNLDRGYQLDGAADHGVSEAVYLRDPDDNGVELYVDRNESEWPRDANGVAMFTRPLDLQSLLAVID